MRRVHHGSAIQAPSICPRWKLVRMSAGCIGTTETVPPSSAVFRPAPRARKRSAMSCVPPRWGVAMCLPARSAGALMRDAGPDDEERAAARGAGNHAQRSTAALDEAVQGRTRTDQGDVHLAGEQGLDQLWPGAERLHVQRVRRERLAKAAVTDRDEAGRVRQVRHVRHLHGQRAGPAGGRRGPACHGGQRHEPRSRRRITRRLPLAM